MTMELLNSILNNFNRHISTAVPVCCDWPHIVRRSYTLPKRSVT